MDRAVYRQKMVQVANKLREKDVEDMKYIYVERIGDGVLEKIKSGLEMIRALETYSCIGPDNLEEFIGILTTLDRPDLAATIKGEPSVSQTLASVNSKLEQVKNSKKQHNQLTPKIYDKVSFSIGIDWRRFGRHLNLNEAELEHIEFDYRRIQDKSMAVLTRWRQKLGEPTWKQLKGHLASFQRYDVIREVEREFNLSSNARQGPNSSSASSSAVSYAPEVSAKVLFPYPADQPNELMLVADEVVRKVKMNENGWWEGEIDGRRGIFPSSFVEIINDTVLPTQESVQINTNAASTTMKPLADVPNLSSSSNATSSVSQNSDSNQVREREDKTNSNIALSIEERGTDNDSMSTIDVYKGSLSLNKITGHVAEEQ